jgi:hypothetical protein
VRRRGTLFGLGLGPVAAVVGLLPWLVTGMRLPLQNLWAGSSDVMPRAFLPFSQYQPLLIVAMLVTGWAAAALAVRLLRPRVPGAVALSLATVQGIALLQTLVVLTPRLQDRTASVLYLAGLTSVVVFGVLVGVATFLLLTRPSRAAVVVGVSLAALALGQWFTGFFAPSAIFLSPGVVAALNTVVRWLPPAAVGIALAWCGVRSRGWVPAGLVSLVFLWLVPAAATALVNSVGSRVLLRQPAELVGTAVDVFKAASTMPSIVLPPLVATVVVAGAGLAARGIWGRSA